MADSALSIRLIAKNEARKAIREAMGDLQDLEKQTGQAGAAGVRMGDVLKLVSAGAVAKFALDTVKAASDVAEAQNKVNVVFGESANIITAAAQESARSMGMSRLAVLDAAGAFGNMFTAMGLTQQEAAGMSTQMVQLASDMASFNNIGTDEALQKLRSGLVGEAEPLRTVGVLLSEAAVKAEAYSMGIAKQGSELTEAQKVQARYSLILQQTATQQGDFAATSDGLANSLRIVQSAVANTQANIGDGLLPVILGITPAIKDSILGFEEQSRIFPQTVARMSALVQLGYLDLELAVKTAVLNMQIATVSAFDAIGVKASELVRTLAGVADAISKIPIPGVQQGAGFSNNWLTALADGMANAGDNADNLRASLERVRQETADRKQSIVDYANSIGTVGNTARRVAPTLGPPPSGLAGAAKAAKTALEELGVSAGTLRSAMDILGFSADEQASILIALGVAAIDAGPLIEGLGITVDKLAAAFDRAGLAGRQLAESIPGLIVAHKEQEKAAKAAEEAERQAAEEAKRAAEEAARAWDDRSKSMGQSIMDALKAGKDAAVGTAKFFKDEWIKSLEEDITGVARKVRDAMRDGLDPTDLLRGAEELFRVYADAINGVGSVAEENRLKMQADTERGIAQQAADISRTWLETLKAQTAIDNAAQAKVWEIATFGRPLDEWRKDAASAAADAVYAAADAARRAQAVVEARRNNLIRGFDEAALANPLFGGAVQYDRNGNPIGLTNALLERLIDAVKAQNRAEFVAQIDGQDVSRRSGVYQGRNSTGAAKMGGFAFSM